MKDQNVHRFGQIQEIVEPIKKCESRRNCLKLNSGDRNEHLDDKRRAAQAGEQAYDEHAAAKKLDRGNEIGHETNQIPVYVVLAN
jgi:hypothetical protein